MEELNKSLRYLEQLNQVELQKKRKYFKIKVEKEVDTNNHGFLKMFLKQKQQFEYKNKMRLKSLRGLAEPKPVPEDFDEQYKKKQDTMFNKEWRKLNNQLKLNRVYRYLKIRQNELEWTQEQYEENKEYVRGRLNADGLKKDVEYSVEDGEIKNCWLIDEKKEENKEENKEEE